eukprot:m.235932 g.235932  ORF g.235932 m.235932 type:complete len:63 (-) comp15767_c0_seq1:2223-2411(-)
MGKLGYFQCLGQDFSTETVTGTTILEDGTTLNGKLEGNSTTLPPQNAPRIYSEDQPDVLAYG